MVFKYLVNACRAGGLCIRCWPAGAHRVAQHAGSSAVLALCPPLSWGLRAQGEHNIYRKWPAGFTYSTTAAKGHLPLTNALRGTQLFKAIMEHPAFEKAKGDSRPDWLK